VLYHVAIKLTPAVLFISMTFSMFVVVNFLAALVVVTIHLNHAFIWNVRCRYVDTNLLTFRTYFGIG